MRKSSIQGVSARPVSGLAALIFVILAVLVMTASASAPEEVFLAGNDEGLYIVRPGKNGYEAESLWSGGRVLKIEPAGSGWYVLSSGGLLYAQAPDAQNPYSIRDISTGLPSKTLNLYRNAAFVPFVVPEDLKDIESDPAVPARVLVCTADKVMYSPDHGSTWSDLGSPSVMPGLKAVAFGFWPGSREPAIWASHAIKGVFARKLSSASLSSASPSPASLAPASPWAAFSAGLPKVFGANIEEVSDIVSIPALSDGPAAATAGEIATPALIAGLSFLGRIYRWNDVAAKWEILYADAEGFGTVESIGAAGPQSLRFVDRSGPCLLNLVRAEKSAGASANVKASATASGNAPVADRETASLLAAVGAAVPGTLHCLAEVQNGVPNGLPAGITASAGNSGLLELSELWLPGSPGPGKAAAALNDPAAGARRKMATGRRGLYLQTGFIVDPASRAKYFALAKERGLDCIVVDLKDDYGRLRFQPRAALLAKLGKVSSPMDVEAFVAEAKAAGIYLVGRVVVFKDETLHKAENGRLAVRDAKTGGTWQGYRKVAGTAATTAPIAEYWVDPYSPEVWEYNVEIAREITLRGFDEVQFDYIRFPTDGENLDDARYPAKIGGMDPESALESFLADARARVDAPISVDIYGSNGWYRSGVRTGQDVEMLSNYVDILCPMLYPSHFEQDFLADAPAELRPYRIYRTGTLRNRHIARGRVLVRPYVQAFYLDVSYDRIWYDRKYVQREVDGVHAGANEGLTFWNNSGRYDDLPNGSNGSNGDKYVEIR
ncbi:MAG: putative glycoside hydrolase [Rectinemataceae bacterium]